jgi:hypothetical protein
MQPSYELHIYLPRQYTTRCPEYMPPAFPEPVRWTRDSLERSWSLAV